MWEWTKRILFRIFSVLSNMEPEPGAGSRSLAFIPAPAPNQKVPAPQHWMYCKWPTHVTLDWFVNKSRVWWSCDTVAWTKIISLYSRLEKCALWSEFNFSLCWKLYIVLSFFTEKAEWEHIFLFVKTRKRENYWIILYCTLTHFWLCIEQ